MPAGTSPLAGQARGEARHILSNPPFTTSSGRSPLAHVFADFGQWLDDAFGPVWRFLVDHLFRPLHLGLADVFGQWWPVVLGAIVMALAVGSGLLLARRRARVGVQPVGRHGTVHDDDPEELERSAAASERAGDYEAAVRLRFRAGLIRLERRGLVTAARTHTTGQLAGTLHSPTFDVLAGELDAILYAGVPAGADQAAVARQRWPLVSDEAELAEVGGHGVARAASGPALQGGPRRDDPTGAGT